MLSRRTPAILIHADDLGMSTAVNAAILGALADGTVTSTSVLATGPAFADAVTQLPAQACLGVHLDLTGFPSITGAPELAGLASIAAARSAELPAAIARLLREHPSMILDEWRAQVGRVREAGQEVTHLDSHQHVHWMPALWPTLKNLMVETGIRAVRGVGAWRPELSRLRALPQAARAARFKRAFSAFVTTEAFANASTFRAREALGLSKPESLEVMVHPGNLAHARYAEELAWLRAGTWRAGTTLVSWRALIACR
ncbi:hypothetical protein LBMAG42_43370 [Deltaproteobacteria bacterium]|nr:hypothetical protein LBMAG42_43370 [Deltaproteobacteria bacterium]